MKEEVNQIINETNAVAERETAHLSSKYSDAAKHGRATRHISIAEQNAAVDYYKKFGRNFDSEDVEPASRIVAMMLAYAMIAMLITLVLYLPMNYLVKSWGNANEHDAVYIAIIINMIISTLIIGTMVEISTKRKAFVAGMRAEADNHVVGNYHRAKSKIDENYITKGQLPDYDFRWKE
jgi:hypothetical protein